jgi:hypothetical protein
MKCRECGATNPPSGFYPMLACVMLGSDGKAVGTGGWQLCNDCDQRLRATPFEGAD